MDNYFNSYREMISLRGLTDHTMKSYSTYIRAYLGYLSDVLHKNPDDISWYELRGYIKWLKDTRSLSDRSINAAISQLQFFTIYVLHKPWDVTQLPLRKFDTYLPFVPTKEEVYKFISTMPDLKQKTMVTIMYSSGLRIGEVCQIRYEHVKRKQMRIYIPRSKSRSDRYAILSQKALDLLTEYWHAYDRPIGWLFPKQFDLQRPIDTFYLSRHIHAHEDRLGWERRITCHSFRHAFGTHLYENGTDLLTIKELLGHKSILSTTIYVHLAENGVGSVTSPFDQMGGATHE